MNDRVTALAALFQGEKTDASVRAQYGNVLIGSAVAYVAYLAGAIPFVGNPSHGPISWLFLLLLPTPLWVIAALHSLMTITAISHGISIRIIEDALFKASDLRVKRDLVGSAARDKIMDITQAKAAHKLITLIVYGGAAFLVFGFTAYALYSAEAIVKSDVVLVHAHVIEIATATYALLAIMVSLSWIVGLRMINKGRGEIHVRSSDANKN